MRGTIWLILLLGALALPFVMRGAISTQSRPATAGRLVIVTPHHQDIRNEFARAFNHWHHAKHGTYIDIDYRVPGGSNDVRRLLEHNYNAYRDPVTGKLPADMPTDIAVIWGGGDFFFDAELKPLGILQPLDLPPDLIHQTFPQDSIVGVRLYEGTRDSAGRPTPLWAGVCLSSFGIVYNPDVFATLKVREPKTWDDLMNERLVGWLALADPTHSGSAAVAYMMVIQRAMVDAEKQYLANLAKAATRPTKTPATRAATHPSTGPTAIPDTVLAKGYANGMRKLLRIAANARYFTDSSPMVPNDVAGGEAAAGIAIDFYSRVYQEIVGPKRSRFVAPAAATAITPDPVAILHGVKGEQRVLANRFVEFLLSPEGQRLWMLKPDPSNPYAPAFRALRRPPVRRDVYADRAGWADNVNPFEEAGDFNQQQRFMGLMTDTRMIWTTAWIDTREELVAAYRQVLKVTMRKQRARLLQQLFMPKFVKLADVQEMREKRRKAEAEGRGPEWRAQQRIHWSRLFAQHYRAIEKNAKGAAAHEEKTNRKKKRRQAI